MKKFRIRAIGFVTAEDESTHRVWELSYAGCPLAHSTSFNRLLIICQAYGKWSPFVLNLIFLFIYLVIASYVTV